MKTNYFDYQLKNATPLTEETIKKLSRKRGFYEENSYQVGDVLLFVGVQTTNDSGSTIDVRGILERELERFYEEHTYDRTPTKIPIFIKNV